MYKTKYNLCLVLNESETHLLMGLRSKEPYVGLFNLLGGKIDDGEDYLQSAYRELYEESGITKDDITLKPFIDFTWHPVEMEMKVFVGKLNKKVSLKEELHTLHWIDINENFFDMSKFAGEGNIGHMVEIMNQTKKKVLGEVYE